MSHPAPPAPRSASFLQAFLKSEALGGYVLMLAALLALLVANSGIAPAYFDALGAKLGFSLGPVVLKESVLHWINDGLMAVFFLLVGLEIKREVLDGQLRGASRIVLPGIAALGGMIMPALIYVLINLQPRHAARLGHSRRHRHRLRTGHPGAAGQPRADVAQDLPDRAGHPDDLGAIIIIALFIRRS